MRVTIETGSESKGRSFEFELLGYAVCDRLQPMSNNNQRPFFAVLAMSDAVVGPVRANILTGRPFGAQDRYIRKRKGEWFEFLKSQRWAWEPQKVAEGTLVTIYRPDLMTPDPGFVDPDMITFGVLVDHAWVAASESHNPLTPEQRAHLAELRDWLCGLPAIEPDEFLKHVPLICAYLDRRTRVPLVQDRVFQVMLCGQLVKYKLLKLLTGSRNALDDIGIAAGYSMMCKQSDFETLAASVLKSYYDLIA